MSLPAAKKTAVPEPILAIGLLTLTTFLTYGALASQLGFYRDDWYFLLTGQSQGLSGIVSLFQIDRIDVTAQPAVPPADMFGAEPSHGWCFYYQKINLARQQSNWQEAARLADEAKSRNLMPDDVSEWMPVLEAYATSGQEKEAKHAAAILRSDENTHRFLCAQLKKGSAYPPPYAYETVNALLCGGN